MTSQRFPRNPRKLKELFYDILDHEITMKDGLIRARKRFVGPWNKGYVLGMRGMLRKQRDRPETLKLGKWSSSEDLEFFSERFRDLTRDPMLRDSDRGYFASWTDYAEYLITNSSSAESDAA
jgi:hypothetical protein